MIVLFLLPPGGTNLERGYGDVRPLRPPFHASPAVCKGPISSKGVSSQDPLLRKFGNFILCSLNFRPNFSSQAPKFDNFQLTSPEFRNCLFASPKFWNFQLTSPPFQRQVSVRKPHTSEIRVAHPYLKIECPGLLPVHRKSKHTKHADTRMVKWKRDAHIFRMYFNSARSIHYLTLRKHMCTVRIWAKSIK